MPAHRLTQPFAPGLPSGANRREDAASGSVELLVARPGGTQRELLDAIAAKACMRVTVDQPGDRGQAPPVQHVDVAAELRELSHLPDRGDQAVLAEHERVLQNVDVPKGPSAQRRMRARGRRELRDVADEQPRRHVRAGHASSERAMGASSP
jgi:hypothetical protein